MEESKKTPLPTYFVSVGSEPKLLIAVQFSLLLYGLRSLKEDVLLTTDKNLIIFSVDYDLVEQKVFWMDLNAESIKWMDMETKKKGTLVKGKPLVQMLKRCWIGPERISPEHTVLRPAKLQLVITLLIPFCSL